MEENIKDELHQVPVKTLRRGDLIHVTQNGRELKLSVDALVDYILSAASAAAAEAASAPLEHGHGMGQVTGLTQAMANKQNKITPESAIENATVPVPGLLFLTDCRDQIEATNNKVNEILDALRAEGLIES